MHNNPPEYGLLADTAWFYLLDKIMDRGIVSQPRGFPIKEVLGCQTEIDMRYPIISNKTRKLSRKFQFREAWWIISGRNDLAALETHIRNYERFSDDGIYLSGAYGPKIVDQLTYITNTLSTDVDSRQAVINIWRERPPASADIPCTLSLQFLIRHYRLYLIATMRSSDAWLGWPYDVFSFSSLAAYVLLLLRYRSIDRFGHIDLGNLMLTTGSGHVYESNFERVKEILAMGNNPLDYAPLNVSDFSSPNEFLRYLETASDGLPLGKPWLKEFVKNG
jgi:thymidylate synthase